MPADILTDSAPELWVPRAATEATDMAELSAASAAWVAWSGLEGRRVSQTHRSRGGDQDGGAALGLGERGGGLRQDGGRPGV
jgi:hypothetical protein